MRSAMFPYKSRARWWISARQAHLADAVDRMPHLYGGGRGAQLHRRVRSLRTWLKVRLVAIIFLSFSLIATIASAVLNILPATADLETGLRLFTRIASSMAGLFTLTYLFAIRTLGQLEIDALLLMQFQGQDL